MICNSYTFTKSRLIKCQNLTLSIPKWDSCNVWISYSYFIFVLITHAVYIFPVVSITLLVSIMKISRITFYKIDLRIWLYEFLAPPSMSKLLFWCRRIVHIKYKTMCRRFRISDVSWKVSQSVWRVQRDNLRISVILPFI